MQHWTTWEVERVLSILRSLARLAEDFRRVGEFTQLDEYGRPTREEILASHAYNALSECTKLLAGALDVVWKPLDAKVIWEEGDQGIQQVLKGYGLLTGLESVDYSWWSALSKEQLSVALWQAPADWTLAKFDLHRPILGPMEWLGRVVDQQEQRASLIAAHRAAQDYIESLQGWLLITGPVGAGKTHLAAAICHKVESRGQNILFLSAPTFQQRYVSPDDSRWLKEKPVLEGQDLLVLDDLDIGAGLIWNTHIEQVLLGRLANTKPTIIILPHSSLKLPDWLRNVLTEVAVVVGSYRRLPASSSNL